MKNRDDALMRLADGFRALSKELDEGEIEVCNCPVCIGRHTALLN